MRGNTSQVVDFPYRREAKWPCRQLVLCRLVPLIHLGVAIYDLRVLFAIFHPFASPKLLIL
jgi:hypothetical protein